MATISLTYKSLNSQIFFVNSFVNLLVCMCMQIRFIFKPVDEILIYPYVLHSAFIGAGANSFPLLYLFKNHKNELSHADK